MDTNIVAIYCLCDDLLKAFHHPADSQQQMTDAEVMTTAIVAALYFQGNFELARYLLSSPLYIPRMLSRSRFNRRLHRIQNLFVCLFQTLATVWKNLNGESIYVIDSFPLIVSENCRVSRSKIYRGQSSYWGYQASKKRFFYGVKLHLMVTEKGEPVEFFLSPASFADVKGLEVFPFEIKEGSLVYGDKAYNDYDIEDWLMEGANIRLLPLRKNNSKRSVPAYVEFVQRIKRKVVETTGSLLSQLLPKSIHAVTPEGFELKLMLFVLALSVRFWVAT